MSLSPALRPVAFADLPGWCDEDPIGALDAFRRSALQVRERPYSSGSLGLTFEAFADAYSEARALRGNAHARHFFERHFVPHAVAPDGGSGFVTGYYEPQLAASPVRTGDFTIPLLAQPGDLVKIDATNRPDGFDPSVAFGRMTDAGIVCYFDRRDIETGALGQDARPIAWLEDKVDAFFVHVQGAARLTMPDGTTVRLTYAAKSGHGFTGPGGVLADLGEIPRSEVTMQTIRAWFRRNPGRVDEILWRNRSYIFFREAPVADDGLGPIAAAKVPLTPGHSIAVDRQLHTFGTPVYVDARTLDAFGKAPFRRLMIAQDTGSAIVGAARGDLFAGTGNAAGEIAGVVRHAADFHVLVPRHLVEGYGT